MKHADIFINNGSTFFISDLLGNIEQHPYKGLVFQDTRHLSLYQLFINGNKLMVLSAASIKFNKAIHILTNYASPHIAKNSLTIIRKKHIHESYLEEMIEITNQSLKPIYSHLYFICDADFSDLFELEYFSNTDTEQPLKTRNVQRKNIQAKHAMTYSYQREDFYRETVIEFSRPYVLQKKKVSIPLQLIPKETWQLSIVIRLAMKKEKIEVIKKKVSLWYMNEARDEWQWSIPKLETDWEDFQHAYTKSIYDLAALRIHTKHTIDGQPVNLPAAGLPWFMTVFGRDSIITSYQTMLLGSRLAIGALATLVDYQGKVIDPSKEEEPGKIMHEIRFGEVAHFQEWVKFPYYGSIDATPLFLILLSEVYRWTGNNTLIEKFKNAALQALHWINTYGDSDGDLFIEYQRKSKRGLTNQNWRDSRNAMVFHNGMLATPPIAPADVQGYVYDAKLRIAEIAENVWKEKILSETLRKEAKLLKEKFNEFFWIKEKG